VLCGGRGTRMGGADPALPKALVEIGGRPILWHVVAHLAAGGISRVLLLSGHRAELVAAFAAAAPWPAGLEVTCLDTGADTPTGGRLLAAQPLLRGARYLATYGDGLADVDLGALAAAHVASGALATVTVVRPELPFGVCELGPDGRVRAFREKPRSSAWVNGGFLVLEPGVTAYLEAHAMLEHGPLERLAAGRELHGYRHEGFWACMDTDKDVRRLRELWASGAAPWRPPGS
jgi:glucose-1-phosphate cytidylyltransferase